MRYRVISADDHLQEAPHTWTARMSAKKWGDRVPQVVRQEDGTDRWTAYGEVALAGASAINVGGAMPDRNVRVQRWEDVPKRAYVPSERLKAMEEDGVDVHTFFGNVAGNAGSTFSNSAIPDEQFRLEAIQAFNDYQIEEFAEPYPGRFIPLAILPMWDVSKAVAELERTMKRGMKGVSFAFPHVFGYPHVADGYWDPLWAALQEADVPLNFHVGAGIAPDLNTGAWAGRGFDFLRAEASMRIFSMNVSIMATILYGGMLERYPGLRVVSAESGIGWVPYGKEMADHHYSSGRLWESGMAEKPSDIFDRQCYITFWFEVVGIQMREHYNLDHVMWESDFPHPTCTYPDSQDYIKRVTAGLTSEEKRKVLVANAAALYKLDVD